MGQLMSDSEHGFLERFLAEFGQKQNADGFDDAVRQGATATR
jgi:hypothetical protein